MDNTQRDELIAAQYMGGTIIPQLAHDHGLSEVSINRILKNRDVDRSQRVKPDTTLKLIDQTHERLGQRLYHHRQFVIGEDRMACAKTIGWSPKKIAMVEQGQTSVTLAELKTIATYMSQSLSQLLEDI